MEVCARGDACCKNYVLVPPCDFHVGTLLDFEGDVLAFQTAFKRQTHIKWSVLDGVQAAGGTYEIFKSYFETCWGGGGVTFRVYMCVKALLSRLELKLGLLLLRKMQS